MQLTSCTHATDQLYPCNIDRELNLDKGLRIDKEEDRVEIFPTSLSQEPDTVAAPVTRTLPADGDKPIVSEAAPCNGNDHSLEEEQLQAVAVEYEDWLASDPAWNEKFKPSNPAAWRCHHKERRALADALLVGMRAKLPELALTAIQTKAIQNTLLSNRADGSIINKAAHNILDPLDVADSFSHAGSKLAAGLGAEIRAIEVRAAAEIKRLERERQLAAQADQILAQRRAETDRWLEEKRRQEAEGIPFEDALSV